MILLLIIFIVAFFIFYLLVDWWADWYMSFGYKTRNSIIYNILHKIRKGR